ncbi:xanthine dehydrogenase family protein subunit M [Desulfosporosinus burensis]
MKLPRFDYQAPRSLIEASALLEKMNGKALVIAGGTDLIVPMKERLKVPDCLVDLRAISGLTAISYGVQGELQIGALVTLRHLASEPTVKRNYPALARAALEVATAQIQAMGTVGGNLCQDCLCQYYNQSVGSKHGLERCHKAGGDVCHTVKGSKECWATYCSDLAPVLLVLGAQIKVVDSTGEKIIPLNDLYTGNGKQPQTLRPGQLLTQIIVPSLGPKSGNIYLKLRVRKTIDYPALGVAVSVKQAEAGQKVSVGLTGVDKRPLLLEEVSREGLFGDEKLELLVQKAYSIARPLNNLRDFTPKYRKDMVKVYVHSALEQALQLAEF